MAIEVRREYLYGGISFVAVGIILGAFLARERIYASFDYKTDFLLLSLETDFRKKVQRLLKKAREHGIELRVISAHRDCEEQDQLYAQGRTAPGNIVTKARCGQSAHNYRRAVDVVEFVNGQPVWENPRWSLIGRLGEAEGLTWGGRWKTFLDRPHFQDLKGNSVSSLYARFLNTGEMKV